MRTPKESEVLAWHGAPGRPGTQHHSRYDPLAWVLRVFVQDPLDLTTRERLMARVMTFRDVQDLATLRSAFEAIARETGLQWTFMDGPDHTNPFGDWVTMGFRTPFTPDASRVEDARVGHPGFSR